MLGAIPWTPQVKLHNPFLAPENGDEFLRYFHQGASRASWARSCSSSKGRFPMRRTRRRGTGPRSAPTRRPGSPSPPATGSTVSPRSAWAVVAAGTCAAYGGIHAMEGNPTGCMGLPDYLGWQWQSRAGMPIVCVPGCPTQPDNMMETLLYLLPQAAGRAPADPAGRGAAAGVAVLSDSARRLRPGRILRAGGIRGEYGSRLCIVKLGCWGPVVQCNVGKRGWMGGIGGCANVGGICIGCTMPGFPDKFMPFMDQPPGSLLSSQAVMTYGGRCARFGASPRRR